MNRVREIINEVKKAVSGKDQVILWMLMAILAQGHVLLEDVPGVGKTTIALAFSRAMGLDYGRVQFTPDVLPSDVTGYGIYDKETGRLRYQPGAVMCNMFLADELNRATSRTQSALLEAMEEGQVTVDGVSHPIPQPFTVIATQNPTGAAGTQLLPDSQLDRFTLKLSVGYPSAEAERDMVLSRMGGNPLELVRPAVTREGLREMQREVDEVYIKDEVVEYIVALIEATRSDPSLERGASPRATLSAAAMAKAAAYVQGRDYVTPRDVSSVFLRAVPHRLLLTPEAEARGVSQRAVLDGIVRKTPAPRV